MQRREAISQLSLLLGTTISYQSFGSFLNYSTQNFDEGKSSFLTLENKKILAEVVEIIIPKTHTPGAKEAKVHHFVELMVNDCYRKEDQSNFTNGFDQINSDCKTKFGKNFLALSPLQRNAIIKNIDENRKNYPFWRILKDLTLLGYFSSEMGANKALAFLEIPGEYKAIKLKKGQKSWAM